MIVHVRPPLVGLLSEVEQEMLGLLPVGCRLDDWDK